MAAEDLKLKLKMPMIPLRDVVIFPNTVSTLFVGREKSIKALQEGIEPKQFKNNGDTIKTYGQDTVLRVPKRNIDAEHHENRPKSGNPMFGTSGPIFPIAPLTSIPWCLARSSMEFL